MCFRAFKLMKEILRHFGTNSRASSLAGKSTMNEDVFPIENGDFPDIAPENGWLEDISPIANGDFPICFQGWSRYKCCDLSIAQRCHQFRSPNLEPQ